MSARSYGKPEFLIGGRAVGPGHPCYVIAEAGANHNRDHATALRLIEVAAEAGSKENSDHVITVRDAKHPDGPKLIFTPDEWHAFVAGVKDGEFDLA